MPPSCFAAVAKQRSILDLVARHVDPFSIDEHLYPSWRHPVVGWPTIILIAATHAFAVSQMQVDVVGLYRPWPDRQKAANETEPFCRHDAHPNHRVVPERP